MNLRKHMPLVIGGAASFVLVCVAGFMLFKTMASYNGVSRQLAEESGKLDRLNSHDPYPSPENVGVVSSNVVALEKYLADVQLELQRDQIEPEKIEPAEFAALLERTIHEVRTSLVASGTKIPDRTSLAFDVYAQGQLPSVDAIPRLVIQAKTILSVLGVLIQAKVDEIIDIQREVFERGSGEAPQEETAPQDRRFASASGASTQSSPALALPPPETNELYSAERIIVTFTAHEHAAWEVLNALARSRTFMVVNHVEIHNNAPIAAGTPPVAEAPAGSAPGTAPVPLIKSHDERIVGGREPINMVVAVDVYRFASTPPAAGGTP